VSTEKVRLTPEQETMLGTLYGRALESRSAHPILRDPHAERVVGLIDYDFRKLGVRGTVVTSIALRERQFDSWTAAFLARHPQATVLHLGCGLDSRVERLDPAPGVAWFDVDYPEVIELRRRLYPARPGYTMVASSVLDSGWPKGVPGDRPTLIVAEGLTMYLPPDEGPPLFRRLVQRFPEGELAFDSYSRLAVRLGKLNPVVRRAGATLRWGIDDPHELERAVPGLLLVEVLRAYDLAGSVMDRLPRAYRVSLWLMRRIPPWGTWGCCCATATETVRAAGAGMAARPVPGARPPPRPGRARRRLPAGRGYRRRRWSGSSGAGRGAVRPPGGAPA
jgi:O-methyltransferase involved in polyketide biosynthesis